MSKSSEAFTSALSRVGASLSAAQIVRDTDKIEKARDATDARITARTEHICDLKDQGWTLQQIADLMHVTPQAIHKIIRTVDAAKKKEQSDD